MSVQQVKITDTKPMMSDMEIAIIDEFLRTHRPDRCLEWGSGNSTIHFSKHTFIKSWLTIEHNGHYVDYLKDKVTKKVQTLWILEGDSYADCVQRSNNRFDFILIDGLDRRKCLENALEIVSKGGVIVLHDAGRPEYQDWIREYKGEIILDGEIAVDGGYAHRGLAVFNGS